MGLFNLLSQANRVSKEKYVHIESAVLMSVEDTGESPEVTVTANTAIVDSQATTPSRRFSLRSLNITRNTTVRTPPAIQEQEKREDSFMPSKKVSSADKRAKNSALALRSLIVGPASTPTLTTSTPNLANIKAQLLQPKTANKVIAKLKDLPACDDPLHADKSGTKGPIHAVCLAYTDAEADALHFSKLTTLSGERKREIAASGLPSMFSVPIDKIAALFNEMHIIDLVNAPDFVGLGQPGDGPGILSGALPTAKTVIEGVERITPELMALGYATGKAVMPDHSGIYPPTDRMSVLTYWWGLELLLPPPSLAYLGNAQSITNAIMNFLSGLALINNGVRKILPFIRYISQYVDFEFNAIRGQDEGKGVVCAATWIMPVALVPRPWDFPTRPEPTIKQSEDATSQGSPAIESIPHDAAKVLPHDTTEVPDTSPNLPIENSKSPTGKVLAGPHETSPLAYQLSWRHTK